MGETANGRIGADRFGFEDEDDDEYEDEVASAIGYRLLTMRCAVSAAPGLQGKGLRVSLLYEDRTDGSGGDWVSRERSQRWVSGVVLAWISG